MFEKFRTKVEKLPLLHLMARHNHIDGLKILLSHKFNSLHGAKDCQNRTITQFSWDERAYINDAVCEELFHCRLMCQTDFVVFASAKNLFKLESNSSKPMADLLEFKERYSIKNLDVNTIGEETEVNPIYAACRQGHESVVNMLIKENADIFTRNKHKESPLFAASLAGNSRIVQSLLDAISDETLRTEYVNQCNRYEKSALAVCAWLGRTDIMSILLKYSASVNVTDIHKNSPLHEAVEANNELGVRLLLQNSAACIDMINEDGESLLDIARDNSYANIKAILVAYAR